MIIINKYGKRIDEKGRTHILCYEYHVCPICGHMLLVIGIRERIYIDSSGITRILVIRRLRCKGKSCQLIHHELPDILIPYKRHCAETVENIVADKHGDVCCDNRTIERIKAWWEACQLYFENALASLSEKYGVGFPRRPAPREIVRAVVNTNLWVHTRSAYLSG